MMIKIFFAERLEIMMIAHLLDREQKQKSHLLVVRWLL
jgi:hypothetical protein